MEKDAPDDRVCGSGFLTIFGPTGPVAVATKSKFLATATAKAKNR
jgi:hypothetical protein